MRPACLLLGLLAATAADATTWSCRLVSQATQIACMAVDGTADETPAETAQPVVVRGTRFPLDPARTWTVDLFGPATDMEGVDRLARASMCYRSPGCSVVWARP